MNTIKYNRYVKSTAIYISGGKFNGPFRELGKSEYHY